MVYSLGSIYQLEYCAGCWSSPDPGVNHAVHPFAGMRVMDQELKNLRDSSIDRQEKETKRRTNKDVEPYGTLKPKTFA